MNFNKTRAYSISKWAFYTAFFGMSTFGEIAHAEGTMPGPTANPATSASASTTPDPFEDYAAANPKGTPVPSVVPPQLRKKQADETAAADKASAGFKEPAAKAQAANPEPQEPVHFPWKHGSWLVGAGTLFAYASSAKKLVSGHDAATSDVFYRFQAHGSYIPVDHVQLGVALGIMGQSLGRETGDSANETDFLFELNGAYLIALSTRFAFTPGLGLGLYFGGSHRTLFIPGGAGNSTVSTTESTSTVGFHATANLLFAYQVSKGLQVRTGLTLTGLVGKEAVDSTHTSLAASALHVGLPLQLNYTF